MAGDNVDNLARTARVDVLFTGYAASPRVAGTVSLVRDADRVIVVDPGMVPRRSAILGPLEELGVSPGEVTDIVLSHHHPDHTVNVALFGEVPVHDFQAVYTRDNWSSRPADQAHITPAVRLLATPGHTPQDLSVLVGTPGQIVALTHLWWMAEGPIEDPYAPDPDVLRAQRERVLALAERVVPGHGPAFTPSLQTPR
jgi:glyoxylase-like metal-dependent hydrolase (beta-lactamase superfamily II)